MQPGSSIVNWLSAEPIAGAITIVTALLLFSIPFAQLWSKPLPGIERIWQIAAIFSRTGSFLALVLSGYYLLNANTLSFGKTLNNLISGGEAGQKAVEKLHTNWGTSLYEKELEVKHFVTEEYIEEIVQRKDNSTLYLPRQKTVELEQESISAFSGNLDIYLINPETNNFRVDATHIYAISNQSDRVTTAWFAFSLAGTRTYENFSVEVDGKKLNWNVAGNEITWETSMQPQQTSQVKIKYQTSGTEQYTYQVRKARAIQDFSLTVSVNSTKIYQSVKPDSSSIQYTYQQSKDKDGFVLDWKIDQAIMAPIFRIGFAKPGQVLSPSVIKVLQYSARSFIFLISLATLTLIICKLPINLWQLAMIAGIYISQYLALIALYPIVKNYIFPLFLLSIPAFLLYTRITKGMQRSGIILIMLLLAIFSLIFPFASLLPGERERNAVDGILLAGIIIYIFGLTLSVRILPNPKTPEASP